MAVYCEIPSHFNNECKQQTWLLYARQDGMLALGHSSAFYAFLCHSCPTSSLTALAIHSPSPDTQPALSFQRSTRRLAYRTPAITTNIRFLSFFYCWEYLIYWLLLGRCCDDYCTDLQIIKYILWSKEGFFGRFQASDTLKRCRMTSIFFHQSDWWRRRKSPAQRVLQYSQVALSRQDQTLWLELKDDSSLRVRQTPDDDHAAWTDH